MTTLKVQKRSMETKAKRLRREGFVTGNLFGKEIDGSIPLKLERKEAEKLLHNCVKGSQVYLDLEGKKYDALVKEIDFDGIANQIIEVDFQALVAGEKVHSVAEIVLHNREAVTEGVLEQLLEEISYKATAEGIVDRVEIDCSKLRLGDVITVADLPIAKDKKVDLVTPLNKPIVQVVASANKAEEADEAAEEK